MIVTYIPPVRVACTYLGAEKIRTITLKNFYKEEISASIYMTRFRSVETHNNYYGLRIQMENGRSDKDLEEALADSVHQMLSEVGLAEKTYEEIQKNEPDSWKELERKFESFVHDHFGTSELPESGTYNEFLLKMMSICSYSAYLMTIEEDSIDDFLVWHNYYEDLKEVTFSECGLNEIGKEVVLKVLEHKYIKTKVSPFMIALEKIVGIFKEMRVQ